MTISFVSLTTYTTTTPTLPSHQRGDVLLMSSVGSSLPTPTSGWLLLGSVFSTTRNGLWYKIATGTNSEVGGTWTGATLLCCTVYRDDTNWLTIGNASFFSGSTFNVILSMGTFPRTPSAATQIFNVAHWSYSTANVDIAGNNGVFTNRGFLQSGGFTIAAFDTNGLVAANTANQTRAFTVGTSGFYSTYAAQMLDTGIPLSGGGSSGISRLINGGLVRGQVL